MFNPLAKVLCIAALASATIAQDIFIALPTTGSTVTAGSNIIVQLDRPMTLTGSEEVAVVIGATSCGFGTCPDPSDVLGNVLYNGPYDPQLVNGAWNPSQNFTVTVPSWYSGLVQIGVVHLSLVGAGLGPELQITNTTINVVSSTINI